MSSVISEEEMYYGRTVSFRREKQGRFRAFALREKGSLGLTFEPRHGRREGGSRGKFCREGIPERGQASRRRPGGPST